LLKIAVDGTCIRGRLSGVGYYTLSLIQALGNLERDRDEFQLSVYFQPSVSRWLQRRWEAEEAIAPFNSTCLPLPVSLTTPFLGWGAGFLTPLENRLGRPQVVHGTDHFIFPCRHSCNLLTIHDLTFIKYPQFVPPRVKTYGARITKCLPYTAGILTFAESTKADLVNLFNFDPDRIYVTYQASRYQGNRLDLETVENFKKTIPYDFSRPYFLCVSTLEPRKNILGLIQAFEDVRRRCPDANYQLVLIGQLGWQYEPILEAIAQSPDFGAIHRLDYLPEIWLEVFYRQALAFVYPSFYEGFGLPVLEAMNFGAPVITSRRSSLPEVAGDGAWLIDPDSREELAEAMLHFGDNAALRSQFGGTARARAGQFSWRQTAQQTLHIYQRLGSEV
jgi:glycosyltransferase involved in cell wall biosynthesis